MSSCSLRFLFLLLILCTSSAPSSSANDFPNPENGATQKGVYVNSYFGLRYPLPAGWTEDLKGPEPSVSGYYSLAALKPAAKTNAAMLIAAQDEFFSREPIHSALDFLNQMKQSLDPALTVTKPPEGVEIAGHTFARLEYSGAGILHSIAAVEIRCHILIFSFSSPDSEALRLFSESLKHAYFATHSDWPACIQSYATPEHLLRRVDPAMVGPRFASVPLRIVIDTQGKVAHVHPIAGLPEQTKAAADAAAQWVFKPYEKNGRPAEVETGVLFEFAHKPE
jgi:hypothetical protein